MQDVFPNYHHAAAFWNIYSFWVIFKGNPMQSMLKLSSHKMTKAWITNGQVGWFHKALWHCTNLFFKQQAWLHKHPEALNLLCHASSIQDKWNQVLP